MSIPAACGRVQWSRFPNWQIGQRILHAFYQNKDFRLDTLGPWILPSTRISTLNLASTQNAMPYHVEGAPGAAAPARTPGSGEHAETDRHPDGMERAA